MNRLVIKSKIDPDGVLRVSVPVGKAEADQEVQLVIEPVVARSEEEHQRLLDATAGAWRGDFERPAQGELENRNPLS